jgi:hypothetical protein
MKAISLKAPWPYAIFHLGKDYENRTWKIKHKGPLLIHVSRNWDQDGYEFIMSKIKMTIPPKEAHIMGAIVGVFWLGDPVTEAESKWFFGPFGHEIISFKEFERPKFIAGHLGIFEVDDDYLING